MACLSWLRARSTVRRDSHMRPHSPIALHNSPLESPTSTCLAPFELDSHAKVSHASSKDTIDRHLYIMTQKKKEWASLPLQRKAEILLVSRFWDPGVSLCMPLESIPWAGSVMGKCCTANHLYLETYVCIHTYMRALLSTMNKNYQQFLCFSFKFSIFQPCQLQVRRLQQ